jgi:hypothetical protein
MSKHHLLPHKPAAHFAVDKNALWGIVTCWQAWSNQTKGSPNIKIREQKPSCSELKKGRSENESGAFFKFAPVLREFALVFRLVCTHSSLVFWKMLDLQWQMAPPAENQRSAVSI